MPEELNNTNKSEEKDIVWDEVEDDSSQEMNESKKEAKDDVTPNLDFILDIPLKLTVELGRTKLLISDLLQLGQGSIIELNKLAGEPLEILVNDKLIARGEAVVVNEKFGVRITDILSPMDRVEKLSE